MKIRILYEDVERAKRVILEDRETQERVRRFRSLFPDIFDVAYRQYLAKYVTYMDSDNEGLLKKAGLDRREFSQEHANLIRKLEEMGIPKLYETYDTEYQNYTTDPNPTIYYFGHWDHPNTGNLIYCAINVNYLSSEQAKRLADKIHLLYADVDSDDIAGAIESLKAVHPAPTTPPAYTPPSGKPVAPAPAPAPQVPSPAPSPMPEPVPEPAPEPEDVVKPQPQPEEPETPEEPEEPELPEPEHGKTVGEPQAPPSTGFKPSPTVVRRQDAAGKKPTGDRAPSSSQWNRIKSWFKRQAGKIGKFFKK